MATQNIKHFEIAIKFKTIRISLMCNVLSGKQIMTYWLSNPLLLSIYQVVIC